MCHLRDGEDLRKELEGTLEPAEVEALMASTHRPNFTCQVCAGRWPAVWSLHTHQHQYLVLPYCGGR